MLTPRQAWRKECRWCSNTTPDNCNTTLCLLSALFEFKSTLQRIKAHCEICNGDDHPKECTGRLLRDNNNEFGLCFLHPFRLGKNPKRKKRTLSPKEYEMRCDTLKKHRPNPVKECKFPG